MPFRKARLIKLIVESTWFFSAIKNTNSLNKVDIPTFNTHYLGYKDVNIYLNQIVFSDTADKCTPIGDYCYNLNSVSFTNKVKKKD